VIKTEFRSEHNRGADVFGEITRIFRIFSDNPGTLPFLVVKQVGSESEHELGGDFTIYVVNNRVLGSSAAKLSGGAERAICAKFRFDRVGNIAGDVRHIAFIHVPVLSRHVPFAVELVVPGEVIMLEVVVGILAVIDAIGATVKIVTVTRGRIVHQKMPEALASSVHSATS